VPLASTLWNVAFDSGMSLGAALGLVAATPKTLLVDAVAGHKAEGLVGLAGLRPPPLAGAASRLGDHLGRIEQAPADEVDGQPAGCAG
jgi:hypothetical protein